MTGLGASAADGLARRTERKVSSKAGTLAGPPTADSEGLLHARVQERINPCRRCICLSRCRQYLTANETIKHVISRCTALPAGDYNERH